MSAKTTAFLPVPGKGVLAHHPRVGDCRQLFVDHQRHLKNRFERRLVPTGKGPPGVGRFELRRSQRLVLAVRVFVGAAIKTVQLVVQNAGEVNLQLAAAGRDRFRRKLNVACSFSLSKLDAAFQQYLAVGGLKGDGMDLQLSGIEHDLAHRFVDVNRNLFLAGKSPSR